MRSGSSLPAKLMMGKQCSLPLPYCLQTVCRLAWAQPARPCLSPDCGPLSLTSLPLTACRQQKGGLQLLMIWLCPRMLARTLASASSGGKQAGAQLRLPCTQRGTGPTTNSCRLTAIPCWLSLLQRCPSAHAGGKQADLQLRFVPASSLNNDGVSAYRDFADLKSSGVKWPTGFTFQIIAVRPESKGKIGLKSDDPWDSPAILPQYLTDKEGRDAATLRWAVAKCQGALSSFCNISRAARV